MNEKLKPTITTIIPTYRRPKLLKKAINSVLKQTYPNFQVCVYDNASGDDTASVVAEIAKADHRVKYYCHTENIGGFNNLQYGLEHVETPFFSFLSDDDFVLPEFYETALAAFENFPDSMFSATDVIQVKQGNILKTALETWTSGFYHPPDGLLAMLKYGYPTWTGILYRRVVIEHIGLLDQVWCLDLDFTLRIAARYPFVISKHPGAVYEFWADIERGFIPFDMRWSGWLKMIQNLTEDKSLPVDVRAYVESVLLRKFENNLFTVGVGYLDRGSIVDAEKVLVALRNHFGKFAQYAVLSVITSACKHVPLARLPLGRLIAGYRYILDQRIKYNQKRYRNLRPYLG